MTSVSAFNDDDNATAFDKQFSCTKPDSNEPATRLSYGIIYAAIAVGIPGNILSAIVWFRRRIDSSSAIFLAALAVSELLFLPAHFMWYNRVLCYDRRRWLCQCAQFVGHFTSTIESLLVLGFSVERLIAITRPLQVCRLSFNHG